MAYSQESYKIVLPEFEGPFDLLLFFIERDELDIYDIPIVNITQDFLNYMNQMEKLNIELASEFILFASMLIRIKAKTLLPRKEINEQGVEIDPREELVSKLIEYKKFKEAAEKMKEMEAVRILQQARGNAHEELLKIANETAEGTEIESVNSFKLAKAFEKVLKRFKNTHEKPTHVVKKYNYSIESQRLFLKNFMIQSKRTSFVKLFEQCENRVHAIFNFLALLEMIQLNYFEIVIGEGRNNFIVILNEEKDLFEKMNKSSFSDEEE